MCISQAQGGRGHLGADELFPVLIYVHLLHVDVRERAVLKGVSWIKSHWTELIFSPFFAFPVDHVLILR